MPKTVTSKKILRIAFKVVAKARPDTIFEGLVFDIKNNVKRMLNDQISTLIEKLKRMVEADLTKSNCKVISIDSSMGNFRGHPYITSFKIKIEKSTLKDPHALEQYLQKYSAKFKFKGEKDGNYEFNTR